MVLPGETTVAVKVWDLPIRIFHWVLVVLFVFQVVTGQIGGDLMPWHVYSGYAMLALVIFRVLWGFAGSTHARFASFIAGPGATLRFARRLFSRQAVPQLGHNPLGGWMVIALVLLLALQTISGLFANDGVATQGPLAKLIPISLSNEISQFHDWNVKLLLLLTGVHLAAVLFHWIVKKENLVPAMFSGVKHVPASFLRERREARRDVPPRRVASRENSRAYIAGSWRAFALFLAAVGLVIVIVRAGH